MSIRVLYEKELQGVFDNLVLMCRHIETAIEGCVEALAQRDFERAREVAAADRLINKLERDIEQSCLRILLMEHPVARDFHEVTAALKMITDLERIGDQTRDIAEITLQCRDGVCLPQLEGMRQMALIVTQMVRDAVKSYLNRDLALAQSLKKTDDKLDELFTCAMGDLIELIKENPENAEGAVMVMMIVKYLERIGDHAENMGEWVEYAITGSHPKKE